MTNFRNSSWLAEKHRNAECPDVCPLCMREEELCDQEPRGAKDFYVTSDFEEYR